MRSSYLRQEFSGVWFASEKMALGMGPEDSQERRVGKREGVVLSFGKRDNSICARGQPGREDFRRALHLAIAKLLTNGSQRTQDGGQRPAGPKGKSNHSSLISEPGKAPKDEILDG